MSPSSPERTLLRKLAADGGAAQGDRTPTATASDLIAEVEAQARRDALLALRATVEGLPQMDMAMGPWDNAGTVQAVLLQAVLSAIDHQLGEG